MWIAEKIYYQGSSNYIRAYQGDELVWDKNLVPLMFTAKANSSSVGLSKISSGQTLEYSTDYSTWTNMTTATTISLSSGQSVYIRGILRRDNTFIDYTQFRMSGNIKASGNINYLWNKDNPDNPYASLKAFCGYKLFSGCTALSDVTELELPATILRLYCYEGMFGNCTSLTSAPALPATALTNYCYNSMFEGCISLTTAPELPATTLAQQCYERMFYNCDSLTTAPELPATTLADGCYYEMFDSCTSLVTAPTILPATTLVSGCYSYMFSRCSSLTTAPELPATTLTTSCYYYMFYACRSLTTAPVLPATTLANSCYFCMFDSCTNLNYIKCLATDISASDCTYNWVRNVSGSGTFVKASSMSSWTTGINGIPTNWTVVGGPDLTKKHWWTTTNGIYNFNLPTRWNNGYRVEVDQYFTGSGNTSSTGSVLRQNSNNSPLEVFYNSGFYFDAHYPNSTTSPTVNTTDRDHRVSIDRSTFNTKVKPNVKYTFKYEMTPTHAIRIYSGSTLVNQITSITDNKNWCTTGDYSIYATSMAARSGWCVVSDIRVYDNNNTLIHNFQLYPNSDNNNGYQYLDIVTDTWYPVVNGSITKVETTDR